MLMYDLIDLDQHRCLHGKLILLPPDIHLQLLLLHKLLYPLEAYLLVHLHVALQGIQEKPGHPLHEVLPLLLFAVHLLDFS